MLRNTVGLHLYVHSSVTGHTTKYNIMSGSWVMNLVVGLKPQATIITIYTASGVYSWKERLAEVLLFESGARG